MKRNLWHSLLFLGFAYVLLLPYLHGHWRFADDAYQCVVPFWSFQERVLALGEWPHWNLNEGIGKPMAITSGAGLFYPIAVLWGLSVGWSEHSYLYFLLLHFAAGCWFAWRFALKAGLSEAGSLIFGLAFVGNGYVMGLYSNPTLTIPYLLWPLLLQGLLELHQKGADRKAATLRIGVSLILMETSGYPLTKLLIFGSTAIGYLFMARKPGTWFKGIPWKPILWAAGLAIVATAPEWTSVIRTLSLSDRMNTNIYDDYTYGSPINFLTLSTLLVPASFLKRDQVQLGMVWLERSWWIGSLTIGLIIAGLASGTISAKRLKIPGIIAIGALLFSMGGHSFVRELAAVGFPILEHLRFSNMGRLVPMAFLAFLGGLALTELEKKFPQGSKSKKNRVTMIWAGFLVLATGFGISEADYGKWSNTLYLDPGIGWKVGVLHTLFYLALAYTAFALKWTVGKAKWPMIVVALHFLALGDTGYAFRRLVAYPHNGTVKGHEDFVMASPQPNERSLRGWADGDDWITWHGNKKVLNAYNVPTHKLVRYAKQDPQVSPLLSSLVSCQEDPTKFAPAPASSPLSCRGTSFQIDRYFGNAVVVSGASASPAVILVHDVAHPYWKARLNGKSVSILTGLGYFKGIEVPAGSWKIELQYDDPWFPTLWLISLAGFLGLVFLPRRQLV